jgi:hypothetical protein
MLNNRPQCTTIKVMETTKQSTAGRKKRSLGQPRNETFILWPEHMELLQAWAKRFGMVDAKGNVSRSRTLRLLLKSSEKWLEHKPKVPGAPSRRKVG